LEEAFKTLVKTSAALLLNKAPFFEQDDDQTSNILHNAVVKYVNDEGFT